jgi:CheY-like chemotaxis protein
MANAITNINTNTNTPPHPLSALQPQPNPHSVLVIEGDKHIRSRLNHLLHSVERRIHIDQVATAEEGKDLLKHPYRNGYDLVIADEYLSGPGTGLELYRYCHDQFPALPFVITSSTDLKELSNDVPPVLDQPVQMNQSQHLIKRLLNDKPQLEKEQKVIAQLNFLSIVFLIAGSLTLGGTLVMNSIPSIMEMPPFTERFIIPTQSTPTKSSPSRKLPPQKIIDEANPIKAVPTHQRENWMPPTEPSTHPTMAQFKISEVFTPKLKATMQIILARADAIIASADAVE